MHNTPPTSAVHKLKCRFMFRHLPGQAPSLCQAATIEPRPNRERGEIPYCAPRVKSVVRWRFPAASQFGSKAERTTEAQRTPRKNTQRRQSHLFQTYAAFVPMSWFSLCCCPRCSLPMWFVPLWNQTAARSISVIISAGERCAVEMDVAPFALFALPDARLDVGAGHRRPVGADPLHQSLINDHRGVSHKANMRHAHCVV